MSTVPSGWGPSLPAGGHYGTIYTTESELVALAVANILAGLKNGEQVLYSIAPQALPAVFGGLEEAIPNLREYVARGQLVQRLSVQYLHAWSHDGYAGLTQLVGEALSDARQAGYPLVRWVGQASLALSEAATAEDWHAMEADLTKVLAVAEQPPTCTTFCLYADPDATEGVTRAHTMVEHPIEPHANVQIVPRFRT